MRGLGEGGVQHERRGLDAREGRDRGGLRGRLRFDGGAEPRVPGVDARESLGGEMLPRGPESD
jgi:hypothetical protein